MQLASPAGVLVSGPLGLLVFAAVALALRVLTQEQRTMLLGAAGGLAARLPISALRGRSGR
jgi:hypothetical protein